MKEFIEGSQAIAKTVKLCRPGVISAYPITPQTHIVESLAQMVADGELKAEFVNVESEHSAASLVLGAAACGVRSFTATSSQGLLLMCEVLFNIAGMRTPLVLTCANRAVSAPINIWNDQQDSVTVRDSGWIQLYAENAQEAVDLHILGYRLSETEDIMLPVMICIDGYILTHGYEVVDIADQKQVDNYLPEYNLPDKLKLNVDNPFTLGPISGPECYLETRYAIHKTHEEVLELLPKLSTDFRKVMNRERPALIEGYKLDEADKVIVAMGSVVGTIKETVDELRNEGQRVGVLKIIAHRPLPKNEIYKALASKKEIAVLDKSISMSLGGVLFSDIKSIFQGKNENPKINGYIAGLGGRDITKETIKEAFSRLSKEETDCEFLDLKSENLGEK
jgi:pyruvate ferredoxin oxidoreductase alpha subunit